MLLEGTVLRLLSSGAEEELRSQPRYHNKLFEAKDYKPSLFSPSPKTRSTL